MTEPEKKRKWLPLSTETSAPISDADYTRLSFPGWFNEPALADLVVHSSKDDNAAKYYCHKFILKCASDKLYEALIKNKIEVASDPKIDHVLIVPELQGKDEAMIKAFLEAIYDESVAYDTTRKAQMDFAGDVCMTYDMPGLRNAMCDGAKAFRNIYSFSIDRYLPKFNAETPLSDITLYLDKEKKTYIKTHRIMLAVGSLYFKGLFTSGMKDSNTTEAVLDLGVAVDQSIFNTVVQKLFNIMYSKEKLTEKSFHGINTEHLVVLSAFISKYLFNNLKAACNMRISSVMGVDFIGPALKYQNQELLLGATQSLLDCIGSIKFSEFPADYLENLRVDNDSNILHALVERCRDCVERLQELEKVLGSKSSISINTANKDGNTCLHIACRTVRANPSLIKWMVKRGMDVNAKNSKGETPLSIALANYVPETIEKEKEKQPKPRFDFLDTKEKKKKKPDNTVVNTVLDHLFLANATMDLTGDENMKSLLSFALLFKENYDKATWKIVEDWLSKQKVERLSPLLQEEYVVHAFKMLNRRPLKLLFGTMKVPFSIDLGYKEDDNDVANKLHVLSLSEIKIGKHKHAVHGMSLCIYKVQRYGKHDIFTMTQQFKLTAGVKKYTLRPGFNALTILKSLIRLEHGEDTKNITEDITPPTMDRW